MSRKGNYNGNLSEKDQLLKDLKKKQQHINDPKINKAIDEKVDALEEGKTIEK